MSLAVGNSSWSIIARPTRHAAPFKPPAGRAATDQLTSRFSPGFGQADFILSPATGIAVSLRKVHPLSLRLCHIMLRNTRVLDDTVRQVYDTYFQTEAKPAAVRSDQPLFQRSCWETVNKQDTHRARREGWEETYSRRKKRERSREGQKRTHKSTFFAERLRL